MAQARLQQLAGQLKSTVVPSARDKIVQKHDDDVVIVSAVRTPLTKARKGGLAKAATTLLMQTVFKEAISRAGIDPKHIDDVIVGNVLSPGGGGASMARMASLAAGIPNTASLAVVNRQCSSGLTSVALIAASIQNGSIDVGIGAGVESMSLYHFERYDYRIGQEGPNDISSQTMENQEAADCLLPMGITSENVAADYGITRDRQDAFAAKSHQKAAAAQAAGNFDAEIAPVTLDDGTVVSKDDGIRAGTTPEVLAKLKPVFKQDGSTTAGNSSQLTDGAAAVLLMRRSKAKELGVKVIGKFVGFSVAGVPPRVMGIGPAFAIPKLLNRLGLTDADIEFYEINEAFASQAVMSVDTLKIPFEKVNPNGSGIALGHPLGATGARQIATGFSHAQRTGQKVFVTSMCIGSGMGAAGCFVSEV